MFGETSKIKKTRTEILLLMVFQSFGLVIYRLSPFFTIPLGIPKVHPTRPNGIPNFCENLEVQRVGDPRRVIVGGQSQGCCVPLLFRRRGGVVGHVYVDVYDVYGG